MPLFVSQRNNIKETNMDFENKSVSNRLYLGNGDTVPKQETDTYNPGTGLDKAAKQVRDLAKKHLVGGTYDESTLREGRKTNILKILGQLHTYLARYDDLDKAEARFEKRLADVGCSDMFAVMDDILDVVATGKKADKAKALGKVYRKYFPKVAKEEPAEEEEMENAIEEADEDNFDYEAEERQTEEDLETHTSEGEPRDEDEFVASSTEDLDALGMPRKNFEESKRLREGADAYCPECHENLGKATEYWGNTKGDGYCSTCGAKFKRPAGAPKYEDFKESVDKTKCPKCGHPRDDFDIVQTSYDGVDMEVMQCPECKMQFSESRIKENSRADLDDVCPACGESLDDFLEENGDYFCPNCDYHVGREETETPFEDEVDNEGSPVGNEFGYQLPTDQNDEYRDYNETDPDYVEPWALDEAKKLRPNANKLIAGIRADKNADPDDPEPDVGDLLQVVDDIGLDSNNDKDVDRVIDMWHNLHENIDNGYGEEFNTLPQVILRKLKSLPGTDQSEAGWAAEVLSNWYYNEGEDAETIENMDPQAFKRDIYALLDAASNPKEVSVMRKFLKEEDDTFYQNDDELVNDSGMDDGSEGGMGYEESAKRTRKTEAVEDEMDDDAIDDEDYFTHELDEDDNDMLRGELIDQVLEPLSDSLTDEEFSKLELNLSLLNTSELKSYAEDPELAVELLDEDEDEYADYDDIADDDNNPTHYDGFEDTFDELADDDDLDTELDEIETSQFNDTESVDFVDALDNIPWPEDQRDEGEFNMNPEKDVDHDEPESDDFFEKTITRASNNAKKLREEEADPKDLLVQAAAEQLTKSSDPKSKEMGTLLATASAANGEKSPY